MLVRSSGTVMQSLNLIIVYIPHQLILKPLVGVPAADDTDRMAIDTAHNCTLSEKPSEGSHLWYQPDVRLTPA